MQSWSEMLWGREAGGGYDTAHPDRANHACNLTEETNLTWRNKSAAPVLCWEVRSTTYDVLLASTSKRQLFNSVRVTQMQSTCKKPNIRGESSCFCQHQVTFDIWREMAGKTREATQQWAQESLVPLPLRELPRQAGAGTPHCSAPGAPSSASRQVRWVTASRSKSSLKA